MADFDVEKCLVKVKSPVFDEQKAKREQVEDCIDKYFEMTPSASLGRLKMSCKTYVKNLLSENIISEHCVDSLAARNVVEAIQGFIDSDSIKGEGTSPQMRQEMLDLYCIAISKAHEYGDFTYEETLDKIAKCHEKCML